MPRFAILPRLNLGFLRGDVETIQWAKDPATVLRCVLQTVAPDPDEATRAVRSKDIVISP